MKAWESDYLHEKNWQRRMKAYNPVPGLTSKQRKRIDKALHDVAETLHYWLLETNHTTMNWLPHEDIVTRDNDARQAELEEIYTAFGSPDKETGEIVGMRDDGIKATNRITVATWYETTDQKFILVKPLFSPLPHDEWGRLPLTLRQWNIIAVALIGSRICWQWRPGVVHYTGMSAFDEPDSKFGIMGWHLDPAVKLKRNEGPSTWTADVILQPIINQFSLD